MLGNDVAGVGNATSGSMTDQLTIQHRMTLDEAHLILNVKQGEEMESILKVGPITGSSILRLTSSAQNYEHLFKANSPAPPPPKMDPPPSGKQVALPSHSHYLQSKVVRARERIEAESKVASETAGSATGAGQPPPPPEAPGGSAS